MLKKADREADFFFIMVVKWMEFHCETPCSGSASRVSTLFPVLSCDRPRVKEILAATEATTKGEQKHPPVAATDTRTRGRGNSFENFKKGTDTRTRGRGTPLRLAVTYKPREIQDSK